MKRLLLFLSIAAFASVLLSADGAPATPQRNDRGIQQAGQRPYLTELFPRTRGLMAYLEKNDPETHAKLLEHSALLLQKAHAGADRFVSEHHPELAKVLDDLEQKKHPAFGRAMGDVVRDLTRLSHVKQRTPKAYPAAVEAWKNRSRLRLRGARIALRRSGGSVEELRGLVTRVHAAERRQTQARIQRMKAQIERLEKKLDADLETSVQRELDSIRKKIERRRRGR